MHVNKTLPAIDRSTWLAQLYSSDTSGIKDILLYHSNDVIESQRPGRGPDPDFGPKHNTNTARTKQNNKEHRQVL